MNNDKIIDTLICLWSGSGHAPETGVRFIDRVLHFFIVLAFPVMLLTILGVSNTTLFVLFDIAIIAVIEVIVCVCLHFMRDDDEDYTRVQ